MQNNQQQQKQQPWTAHLDLYGNPECDYHAQLTIGSTLMNLVLDTGSANTAVISDLCSSENCTFVQKPYLPIPDSYANFDTVNASYGNAKLHSSWKGYATGQLISFDHVQQAFARIDVITDHQSFFIPRCSKNQGIWGLAHPSLQTRPRKSNGHASNSEQQKLTLFDSIRREKGLPNAFTVQICPKSAVDSAFAHEFNFLGLNSTMRHVQQQQQSTAEKTCLRDGHFWLGGYPSQSVGSEIVWVPLSNNRYYEVKVDHFLVNGKAVAGMEQINVPRTIVDTGTKDIVLTPQNLQKLLHALWHSKLVQFDDSVSKEHEKSFWFDHAQLSLPKNALTISHNASIAIAFEGNKVVSLPIENILNIREFGEQMPDWVNVSWTGFANSGGNGNMASTILGNTLFRGKTVIFDRGREEDSAHKRTSRIGFADASACCRASSGKDVDILLSADSVTKISTIHQDHGANTVQICLILLIALSGIGFFSTMAVFMVNNYQEKKKKAAAAANFKDNEQHQIHIVK
ncbi:hypothetical protein HMPREF1544_04690 [Mucor circinelloides 1006PhL]|uniref:Peptidase A1 domain-containing protein n=1 Tax=Mucor circinelloides f. circinelloides (strain 1006PhL) TaxID=1220926 RepID=S2K884_MUCC1|nr:hypothetical protein HMPREF1544_04690 [Mucor circinelloides 1006PhL]